MEMNIEFADGRRTSWMVMFLMAVVVVACAVVLSVAFGAVSDVSSDVVVPSRLFPGSWA